MLYFYVTPVLIGYVFFLSESGEMCAMKEVTLCSDDPKSRESAQQLGQEISVLSRLRHQNIVQYYGSETVSFTDISWTFLFSDTINCFSSTKSCT
jgi:serine/threonine protein kinase